MYKVREESSDQILAMEWSGLLGKDELQSMAIEVDDWVKEHGPVRFLCVLDNFQGFDVQANWARAKWQFENHSTIECAAFVGPEDVANPLALVLVTTVDHPVEVFGPQELDKALAWLKAFPSARV